MSDCESAPLREDLGTRLQSVREELYGPDGVARLAAELDVPAPTWRHYEQIGELAPAQLLLRFIELTGVDPLWLLSGEGPRYRPGCRPGSKKPGHGATNWSKPRGD